MPEIIVPAGQERDGWITVWVNGEQFSVKAGEPTELETSVIEALGHAGIEYVLNSNPGGLPEGAVAFADFKNGTYSYGSNTFDDFLTEDTDYGTWDATVVLGTGLVPDPGQQYISVASALTADLLASGFTVVANIVLDDPVNAFFLVEALDLPDWMKEHIAHVSVQNTYATGDSQVFRMDGEDAFAPGPGAHRFAVSISSAGALCSLDGGETAESPFTGTFDANHIGIVTLKANVEDMTFYIGPKTAGELEAMSA